MKTFIQVAAASLAICITASPADPPAKKTGRREGNKAAVIKMPPAQLRAGKIVIPKLDYRESTIRSDLNWLQLKSQQMDPEGAGVNIIAMLETDKERAKAPGIGDLPPVLDPERAAELLEGPPITLLLENVTVSDALDRIANAAGLAVRWDEYAVFVSNVNSPRELPNDTAKNEAAKAKPRPPLKNNSGKVGARFLARYSNQPILPKADFRDASLSDVMSFVATKTKELDQEHAAFSMILRTATPFEVPEPRTINFTATNIPTLHLLRYAAELSGYEVTIDPLGVLIAPPGPANPKTSERPDAKMPPAKAERKTAAQLRAEKIKIPKVDLDEVTVREALDYLTQKSRQHAPNGKGINIVAKLDRAPARKNPATPELPPGLPAVPGIDATAPGIAPPELRITLKLSNVPATEVLKYIANLTNLVFRWDEHAVFVSELSEVPLDEHGNFKVPPRPPVKNHAGATGAKLLAQYAAQTSVPKVEFRESSLRAAIEFFTVKHGQLTKGDIGMNLALKLDEPAKDSTARPGDTSNSNLPAVAYRGDRKLTLFATDLPLFELLRYIAEMSGCEVVAENDPSFQIVLRPAPSR